MPLERDDRSLQVQIKQILREEIARGVWHQGAKLPTEPELMRRFCVSRITISQALRDMTTDGLLVRRQGKGTFVSSHPQGWTNLGALLQRVPPKGQKLEHTHNYMELAAPPADIALDLQLTQADHTWLFNRIKLMDGAPAQWEQAYIPAGLVISDPAVLRENDWGRYYFIEILQQLTGQEARRCRAFLQAVVLNEAVATAMGETPGRPAIEVTRLWHNELGHPVLLTRSVLRPDGTRYFVDLPEIPTKGRGEG
jgi:GntR family transcriptional regulator